MEAGALGRTVQEHPGAARRVGLAAALAGGRGCWVKIGDQAAAGFDIRYADCGDLVTLVDALRSAEQARAVESAIEAHVGIVDRLVDGEHRPAP